MSITKHVTLQKIVAHDFRYDPHKYLGLVVPPNSPAEIGQRQHIAIEGGSTASVFGVPG